MRTLLNLIALATIIFGVLLLCITTIRMGIAASGHSNVFEACVLKWLTAVTSIIIGSAIIKLMGGIK